MNASISVVCYKSKTLSNGESPLMLQITKDKKRKYQSLGISVNPKHWNFLKGEPKPNCPNRDFILKIILAKKEELQRKVLEFNSRQREYSVYSLLKETERTQHMTVGEFYLALIDEFERNGKLGNRRAYKGSYNSLNSFTGDNLDICFEDITQGWLLNYESWLRAKGNKETTISIQFRTLRSVYNKAIKRKCVGKEYYPFEDFHINKFNVHTDKRAISKNDVLKIISADLTGKSEYVKFSRDIFVFSYLCGGINFCDVASLTKENILNGRLFYVRQKTGKQINLCLTKNASAIIDKYYKGGKGFLFPILDVTRHITATQRENRLHKVLGQVDKSLKIVAQIAKVDVNLTTYVARHSYATVLKRSGVPTSIICESLGHSSERVTQIYLDSFENEQIDEAMKNLL